MGSLFLTKKANEKSHVEIIWFEVEDVITGSDNYGNYDPNWEPS